MSELTSYESAVNSFYLAFFGRPADPAGLKFWSGHLVANGGDYSVITREFAASEEARVRFGDDSTEERIAEIYQQLFNRAPDATGLGYWTNVVEQGHASLADVAIVILNGAQGADARLVDLREGAVADFTARVAETGSEYSGYAAVEAARVLARAVTPGASADDIAKLVQATAAFADIASTNPAVIDAIATGSSLLALFDTPRGLLDPVTLAQALADVAKAAAGNPATLESLLRGGGMAKVLDVMPAKATLQDVVEALAAGGLPAAIDVVYPPRPVTPAPAGVTIEFAGVDHGPDDRAPDDHITNEEVADVRFSFSGSVRADQKFQYKYDEKAGWVDVTPSGNIITVKDVYLMHGEPENLHGKAGMGIMEVVGNLATTIQVQLLNADGSVASATTEKIVFDGEPPQEELTFLRIEGEQDGVKTTGQENASLTFSIDGRKDGIIQWRLDGGKAWTDVPNDGKAGQVTLHGIDLSQADRTVELRVIDAAGNEGDSTSVKIDGPAGVTVKATAAGLEITSSVAGTITMAGEPLISNAAGGGAIKGTVLVGAQDGYRSGAITVTPDEGAPLHDNGDIVYQLGRDSVDNFIGTHMWGFGGNDNLRGSLHDDFISGGEGDDLIVSNGGSDHISGGLGADRIVLLVDGKGSVLEYDEKETWYGRVFDGDTLKAMDQITGAEAGDVIQLGDIFKVGPGTVSKSFLASDESGYVAVVRGTLDPDNKFSANSFGTSYMVQWTDAVGINSVLFNDYAGAELDLKVDREKGTLTLVDAPVMSTFDSIAYRFGIADSAFYLDGSPDGITHSGVGNGLLPGSNFTLINLITAKAADPEYTSGPRFGIGNDDYMVFGDTLKAGAYVINFNDQTFATASGYFGMGTFMFAGGAAGLVVHQGFSILTTVQIGFGDIDYSNHSHKLLYRANSGGGEGKLYTGTSQDAIAADTATLAIGYRTITGGAHDLIMGFGSDDKIVFEGVAETAIDKNQDGLIKWADGVVRRGDEAVIFDIDGELVTSDLERDDSASMLTMSKLNVKALQAYDELLILARDLNGNGAALLHYSDLDGNGEINGTELVVIATFSGSVPDPEQITLIGTYAE